ncbi:MAG: hypothetical protein ABI615_13330 [Chthoniobacterales bacterium]
MKIHCLLAFSLLSFSAMAADYNAVVLEQIRTMPTNGGYSASHAATEHLKSAIAANAAGLEVNPTHATPSYCSGATYLVFLKTLHALSQQGELTLSPETTAALLVKGQRDGQGVWGRWNANGPGTPVLFEELHLGKNFTDIHEAKPGDFMKIFWSDKVGSREHGHSVIFLGLENHEGRYFVRFWSSNIPSGYGEKSVPASRIVHAIFSRLEHPQNISGATALPPMDSYLASLVSGESSFAEAKRKTNAQ